MPGENFKTIDHINCCATCCNAFHDDDGLVCTIEDKTGDVLNPDDGDDCEPLSIFDLCDSYKKGTPHRWE